MIVKFESYDGWEWIDGVKKVWSGPASSITGFPPDVEIEVRAAEVRSVPPNPHKPATMPLKRISVELKDGTALMFDLSGEAFLLSDTGGSIDRLN